MKKNKKAFGLVLAMFIVIVSLLLSMTVIEYIFPFSRSVVDMENSIKSYYFANSWIESGIYELKKYENDNTTKIKNKSLWSIWDKYLDSDFNNISNFISYKTKLQSSFVNIDNLWDVDPFPWKWESSFDEDFNTIYVWNPIQIEIWRTNILNPKIQFKIPKITLSNNYKFDDNSIIINWILSSEDWFIQWVDKNTITTTSWSVSVFWSVTSTPLFNIKWKDINSWVEIDLYKLYWSDKDKNLYNFQAWYNHLNCLVKSCILRFSIVNDLKVKNWSWHIVNLPYLEWKFKNSNNFRKRYADIHSRWKSYWYMKKLDVKVPQVTLNEAFDFAVFQ